MDAIPALRDGLFFWGGVKIFGLKKNSRSSTGLSDAEMISGRSQARLITPRINAIRARTINI